MAGFSENRLKEEIKTKDLRSIYYLSGEDPFLIDYYTNQLSQAFFSSSEGKKTTYFGDEISVSEFLDESKSLSLWDPQKFIVVKQAERISSKTYEGLIPLIKEPLEKCLVVFQSTKIDARWKFFQALQKSGSHCALLKLDPPEISDWNYWLGVFLRKHKKELEEDAKSLLQEWTRDNLTELGHLIERASIYVGDQRVIRRQDVLAVGFRVTPEDVFAFTESILRGDSGRALSLLNKLLDQGEEPLALVGLISRQYRWLLQILAMRAEGKSDAAIASAAGIFPTAAKHLFPASRRLGGKKVIASLRALAEVDFRMKTSKIPERNCLSELVMQIC